LLPHPTSGAAALDRYAARNANLLIVCILA
jgi:hypothetical protein